MTPKVVDPHGRRQNPFETPWQVAQSVLEHRRQTRLRKAAMSRRATALIDGLADEESEAAMRVLMGLG